MQRLQARPGTYTREWVERDVASLREMCGRWTMRIDNTRSHPIRRWTLSRQTSLRAGAASGPVSPDDGGACRWQRDRPCCTSAASKREVLRNSHTPNGMPASVRPNETGAGVTDRDPRAGWESRSGQQAREHRFDGRHPSAFGTS